MKREDLSYEYVMNNITPQLYDLESMYWVVVARDLVEKYGRKGEQAARTWMRRHAGWRGYQIRKGSQCLGVPVNVENMYTYTDLCINNAFTPLWKKDYEWTPYKVEIKVSPGECVIWDRFKQHDIGFLGDVFCDEMHQSFTNTYHPEAAVVVPECMSKGDDHCFFRWVLPGSAKEPEILEPYPGEDITADWKYDNVQDICTGSLRKMMRWYGAETYYLHEVLVEFFPEVAEEEFKRLISMWEVARAECILERKPFVKDADPKTVFENLDVPYTYTWQSNIKETENGIDVEVSYCPFAEVWKWLEGTQDMTTYCDTCYKNMIGTMSPDCKVELKECMTKGDCKCKLSIIK